MLAFWEWHHDLLYELHPPPQKKKKKKKKKSI